jgi:hypothetical protein
MLSQSSPAAVTPGYFSVDRLDQVLTLLRIQPIKASQPSFVRPLRAEEHFNHKQCVFWN